MIEPSLLERLHGEHVAQLAAEVGRALVATGWDAAVIHSGAPRLRSAYDDQYWPLRATPHFQHWLPLARPDCAVVVAAGRRPVLVHNLETNFWERPAPPETDHFWPAFDLVEAPNADAVKGHLPRGRVAFIGEDVVRATAWGFSAEARDPAELLRRLDDLRTRKTAYEILCLAEANRRAASGHLAVRQAFLDGDASEFELHLLYLRATSQDDPETPYKNIVATGPHAATLHHVSYGRAPSGAAAESLLVDAGATCQGYDSDVTRTHVKGRGAMVDVFRGLASGLERLQQELCRRVKPGVPYEALHDQSHELLAPLLLELGIARGSEAELVGGGVTRAFLPHGLGHSLGLQTHDVGCAAVKPRADNPFLRNTSIVEAGQVFTIEPGCYFIDEMLAGLRAGPHRDRIDWRLVDELARFGGVRIEDDLAVAVGPDGATRNLTREVLPD